MIVCFIAWPLLKHDASLAVRENVGVPVVLVVGAGGKLFTRIAMVFTLHHVVADVELSVEFIAGNVRCQM